MENSQGALYFTAGVDLQKWKSDIENIRKDILGVSNTAESKDILFLKKQTIADQKAAIKDIQNELKKVYDEADKLAPGIGQATILDTAKRIEGDLQGAKNELSEMQQEYEALKVQLSETGSEQTRLSTKFNEAKNRLAELNLANKQGTEEYAAAEAEIKQYGQALEEANAQAKALTSGGIGTMIQALTLGSGILSTATALTGAFGDKNENLNNIMAKSQALLAATVTLQELKNSVIQKGGILSGVMAAQEYARARGADAATLASGRATIAQRAWNLVANANPYLLLATAIISVVGAIGLYVAATNQAEAKAKALIDLNKSIADSAAEPLVAYKTLQNQWNSLGDDLKAKEKFITDNKDEFAKLGVEVNNTADAENVLRKNSGAFVQAMMLRAKSAALAQIAIENMKRSLELESEYKRKNIDKNLTVGEIAIRTLTDGPGGVASRKRAKDDAEEVRKSKQKDIDLAAEQLKVEKELEALNSKSGFKTPTSGEKVKKKNASNAGTIKTKDQVADEYLPPGSVAEIQKRLAAIDKALSRSNSEDSTKRLKDQRIAVALELAAAEKKTRIRSFDEEMADTKKQIELRDRLLQAGYSKDKVDSMLPEVKDKSYIGYLEETEKSLRKLTAAGDNSEQTATNLLSVNAAIDEFKGKESFIEGVSKAIEDLNSKFSGAELISELEKYKNTPVANETEAEANARKLAAEKAIESENKAIEDKQRQFYANFLKDKETFEQKKKEIDIKYNSIDAAINNSDNSAEEKARLLAESAKERGAEYSSAFLEGLKNTTLWQEAFGNIADMTNRQIKQNIANLKIKLKEAAGNGATAAEIKAIQDRIVELQRVLNNNPFEKIASSFKILRDESTSTADKLKASQDMFNGLGEGVKMIGDAFGGFGEEADAAIGNIMEIGNAAFDLGKSIASGDVAGMISAGIKLIGSIGKAINGDNKKERKIKRQAAQLKELETAYNALAFAAERAFGSQKYSGQRDLIKNLEQQKAMLQSMLATESSKKKADKEKMAGYQAQIQSINQSIAQIKEGIIKDVLQTDVVDAAAKVGDALVDAFGRGEDAVESLENAAQDMIKNLLRNQLNLALQNKMKPILDNLLAASGFNQDGSGSFTGLTPEQIAAFKAQVVAAGQSMQGFLEGYADIFGELDPANAQGLKGDIKGVTEKTAGALEAQINAMRINQVVSLDAIRNSLLQLVAIEANTRHLIQIRSDIAEMNGKMQKGLAGVI